MRRRVAAAPALALVALAACSKHEELPLSDWLKIDVVRPITGSGTIEVGSRKEVWHVKAGNGWKRLGTGRRSNYMLLTDPDKEYYEPDSQPALLVDLNDGKGVQIVRRGERALRTIKDALGVTGKLSVPASRTAIDIVECRERVEPVGCRDMEIHRYHPKGPLVRTFHIPLGDTYRDCGLVGIRWYNSSRDDMPIVSAQCLMESEEAFCLWLWPQDDGLFVHAVGKDGPARECSDSVALKFSKGRPERFDVLK